MHAVSGRWRRGQRFLERQILLAVLAIVAHPVRALLVAGVMLALCGALALSRLDISSDQNKLFSTKVKFFRDYIDFDDKFPENEAVYVVVEAIHPSDPPPVLRWIALAHAISESVLKAPGVESIDSHI